VEADTWFD